MFQAVIPALESPGVGQVLRLVVEDPPPSLKPGMIAEVRLPVARSGAVVRRHPGSAMLQRGQLDGVFVVEEQTRRAIHGCTLRWITLVPSPTAHR